MSKDKHTLFALSPDMSQIVGGKPKTIMKNLGIPSKCSYTGKYGDTQVPCFAVTCLRNSDTETFILQEKYFRVTPTDKVPQFDKETMKLAISKSTNGSWFKKIIGKTPEGINIENTDLDKSTVSVGSQSSEVPGTQQEEDVDIGGDGDDDDEHFSPVHPYVYKSKNPVDNKEDATETETQATTASDNDSDENVTMADLTRMFVFLVVIDL